MALSKHRDLAPLLVARGAPTYYLSRDVDVTPGTLEASKHAKYKTITPSDQYDRLLSLLQDPTKPGTLHVIGARDDEATANVVALAVMVRAMRLHVESPENTARPLYHPVYGGVNSRGGAYDSLRDSEANRQTVGHVSTLILTNLAVNSTRDKIEKARDLLTMYATSARVLVVTGEDPLHFAVDALMMRPTGVTFLGYPSKQQVVQI